MDTNPGTDLHFLRRAIALSNVAGERGDHPFGAVLVRAGVVIAEAGNTVHSDNNPLAHAETNLVRQATQQLGEGQLAGCTLYTSTEPCMMCCGALYVNGVSRVVFALPSSGLGGSESWPFHTDCRTVLAAGQQPVVVVGPLLADEAAAVHARFW